MRKRNFLITAFTSVATIGSAIGISAAGAMNSLFFVSLASFFPSALFTAFGAIDAVVNSGFLSRHKRKGISLAAGEQDFAKSIFGSQIDIRRVKKYIAPREKKTALRVKDPFGIFVCGKEHYSEDYSREKDAFMYSAFIHEMTHVWQYQKGFFEWSNTMFLHRGYERTQYDYEITARSRFKDFCCEQQAAIVGDYALRFLHPDRPPSYQYTKKYGPDTQESDALLQRLVETQFPQAGKTRLALEEKERIVGEKAAIKAFGRPPVTM